LYYTYIKQTTGYNMTSSLKTPESGENHNKKDIGLLNVCRPTR